jgi:hypothetical protein
MKQLVLKLTALVLLCTTAFWACTKKDDGPTTSTIKFDNSTTVNASITGQVLDENGNPLVGAVVRSGTNTYTTGNDGFFMFNNITCKQRANLISVSKAGYFPGYRTLQISAGKQHYTRLSVLKMDNPQTFATSAGATINANGSQIKIPANAIINKSTGQVHAGTVNIYAKTIKSDDANIGQLTPGALRGVTTGSEENTLATYGMIAVEMQDGNGNALQIAPGQSAEIRMQIPASQQANAPSTIQLWHFDEAMGMWVEEGKATRVGNEYVGQAPHFSFWNYDIGSNGCTLDCTVIDQATGNGLSGYQVKITGGLYGSSAYGWTNATGYVTGAVFINSTYTLEVTDPICGNIVHTQTFSTGIANVSLGNISVTLPTTSSATVTGTVLDCNSNGVTNGMATMQVGNTLIPLVLGAGGSFSWTGIICNPPTAATIAAFDLTAGTGGSTSASLVAGTNSLGNIAACGAVLEFHNFSITDGAGTTNYSHVEPLAYFDCASIGASNTTVNTGFQNSGGGLSSYESSNFVFDGSYTTGNHTINSWSFTNWVNQTSTYVSSDSLLGCSVPVSITAYGGSLGTFVNGSYSGSFVNGANTYTVSGSFAVKRDF